MSGCSAIYFLDQKGKIIIYRDYRGQIGQHVNDRFQKKVLDSEQHLITPVFQDGEFTFIWLKHNNVYIVAVCKGDPNVAIIFSFLYKLVATFTQYYQNLEDETLRDNFVTTYELLDEMMDHGYPQITECKILQEYIKTEANRKKEEVKTVPTSVTGAVSWRSEGVKHKKNEIFLDVIQKLDILVAANGNVLRSEILGVVKMKSFLSGMPELKLGLNDKIWFETTGRTTRSKTVEMDDIKFHQCVRLSRFESDRTISFIPPDGDFELMSYRLNTHVKPLIWVEAVIENYTESKIEYSVRVKGQFKPRTTAHNVEILVPVPSDADSPVFKSPIGSIKYVPDRDGMLWTIKQFQGQKEFIMRAHFGFPSVASQDREQYARKPIQVKFEIPYFTVSGIQVRYLKIVEKSNYQALPWVRYIAMNGDYQLRMF